MEPFNLRATVRDVLAGTNEADPGVIAGMVLAAIKRTDRDAALTQAMRLFVRQIVSETRNCDPVAPTPIRGSSRVQAIRDGWQKHLRDRVHCPDGWKLLADCTYDDLLAAAVERRELADRNQARARQYDGWARLLTEHDVTTFGDLPAEVQMRALGRAA